MYLEFGARGASATPPNSYYEPPEPKAPRCPICGAETDTFKKDHYGEIVGCDECVKDIDAWDYVEDD